MIVSSIYLFLTRVLSLDWNVFCESDVLESELISPYLASYEPRSLLVSSVDSERYVIWTDEER